MSDPTVRVKATELLLRELLTARAAAKRSTKQELKECPSLDALILQLYNVRARTEPTLGSA